MDGFGAGAGQSLEAPFGHADRRGGGVARLPVDLASWAFATGELAEPNRAGGSRGLDDYFTRDFTRNIGAEIMGRNKFGPQRGPWENLEWERLVGRHPALPTPPCSSSPTITDPASRWPTPRSTSSMPHHDALQRATDAADGKDVRLGAASHHSAVLGGRPRRHHPCRRRADRDRPRGATLDLPRDLLDRFHLESVPSPSGVTHLLFWRR